MAVILSRDQLHQSVWKTRIRDLVATFGLSEPTIKKRCRDKDIPIPGAAYWAKLAKGQLIKIPALPARGPGMDELVSMAQTPERPTRIYLSDSELLGPVPPPPIYSEPLEDIRSRYLAKVGSPKVPRDLAQAHYKIRVLLVEDDRRREMERRRGYASSYDGPRFDSVFEQRRLRVLNALMMAVLRAGGEIKVADQYARSLMLHVNDMTLHMSLDHIARINNRHVYHSEAAPVGAPLNVVLSRSWGSSTPEGSWSDGPDAPLERMIGPIVAEFFVIAEGAYRSMRIWENTSRHERKAACIEAMQQARERAEKAAKEKLERERVERIDRLLSLAAKHHQAQTIRAMLFACSASQPGGIEQSTFHSFASQVAAELDPVTNGELASVVSEQPSPPCTAR